VTSRSIVSISFPMLYVGGSDSAGPGEAATLAIQPAMPNDGREPRTPIAVRAIADGNNLRLELPSIIATLF
ncbi:MAG: hypothetical protein WBV67_00125, partial [Candidatus Cybelea sp.]